MVAYKYHMPAGVPGNVTRAEQSTIEAQAYDPAVPFPAYGVAMKTVNGKMQPIGAGDTATAITGLLVRPFPTMGNPATGYAPALGVAVPPTTGICNRLRRGYMMIQANGPAVAAKDGPVYIRVGAGTTAQPIGGFEAAPDATPANTILVPNATFMGAADAQGYTEIAYNI